MIKLRINETVLIGEVKVGGVDGEIYTIKQNNICLEDDENVMFEVESTKGYFNDSFSDLQSALNHTYRRVRQDKQDAKYS